MSIRTQRIGRLISYFALPLREVSMAHLICILPDKFLANLTYIVYQSVS